MQHSSENFANELIALTRNKFGFSNYDDDGQEVT
jgi:hypothetical protein